MKHLILPKNFDNIRNIHNYNYMVLSPSVFKTIRSKCCQNNRLHFQAILVIVGLNGNTYEIPIKIISQSVIYLYKKYKIISLHLIIFIFVYIDQRFAGAKKS